MKFIHTADLHLDSTFSGLPDTLKTKMAAIKDSTNQAFFKMVDYAIENSVELVVIVGDLFDSHQPSPSAQIFLQQQLERLGQAGIFVVLSFGNHDYLNPADFFARSSDKLVIMGETPEKVTITMENGFQVDVVGFSYQTNHINEDIVAEFPTKTPGRFMIGMIHGSVKANDATQNVYAPFTLSELTDLNYQYFALGHIHKRETLNNKPFVGYSGNIQGRNINETGPKGFYEVDVNEQDLSFDQEFIAVNPISYQEITVVIDQKLATTALEDLIVTTINQEISTSSFVIVKITGAEFLTPEQTKILSDSNLWRTISQNLSHDSEIVRMEFILTKRIAINPVDQAYFDEAKELTFTKDNIASELKKLASQYEFIAEHLNSDEDIADLKRQAEFSMQQVLTENETE